MRLNMQKAILNSTIPTNADVVVNSKGMVKRGPDSIIVDDSNPAILYGSGWQTDYGTSTANVNPQFPFNSTLHAAFKSTEFSYNFTGEAIATRLMDCIIEHERCKTGSYVEAWIAGTNAFDCFLDGVKLGSSNTTSSSHVTAATTSPTPLLSPMCTTTTNAGQHTLRIQVNGTADDPFWVDFIRYVPNNSTNLAPAPVASLREFSLTTTRSDKQLSEQWNNQGTFIASMVPGATLVFNFTGASVAGLGIYNNDFAHNSSVGSYAVDDDDPTYFLIENLSTKEQDSLSNQVLFQTPQYRPSSHQIKIIYYGNPETAPLLMTSLLVHDQIMNLATRNVSNATVPVSSSPTSSAGMQGIDSAGPIIYGLCGAFLGILGILALLVLYNRRRRQLRDSTADSAVSPFPALAGPPFIPPSKQMRQLFPESDPVIPQISTPSLPNPLRKTRGLFSARISPSMVRSRQAPIAQMNTNQNSGDVRHSPSIRLLVHEDSGVRLERHIENQTTVVEVPPTYTPL
ncbi:hypothetical protein JR316_0005459 [Psilocybe cubensis]|uniref:Uncharacterized protein n=2 Tax=Psilocybe cubensis TaxID=181762 RepID=A0ACB8H5Z0_PSICU|nr:hypothetical protein JR316_0005459 [Psilocybe cubensis]KAH9483353.1 hypothetical protein JR316_0005459 [Psilocybe cubensis]